MLLYNCKQMFFEGSIDQKCFNNISRGNDCTPSNLRLQRSLKHINPCVCVWMKNSVVGHLLPSIAVYDVEVIAHGVG